MAPFIDELIFSFAFLVCAMPPLTNRQIVAISKKMEGKKPSILNILGLGSVKLH